MAYKYIKGKNKIRGEQTFVDNVSGSNYISASYFVGDGSLLTNLPITGGINSVYTSGSITGSGVVVDPIILKDPLLIGTVTASIGFRGDLFGTASFANTASYALNAGSAATGQGPEGSLQFKSGSGGDISGSSNLIFDHTVPKLTVNSGFVVNRTSISNDISITAAQHIIGVDTSVVTGAVTLLLPDASTLSNGQMYIVKDEGGEAELYNIIISCSVGQTIDGTTSVTIESPYAAVNIYCNGNDKYFVY